MICFEIYRPDEISKMKGDSVIIEEEEKSNSHKS